MFTFYAYMRDGREIFMAEHDKPDTFVSILKNFENSDHIDRFTIYENDKEYMTKVMGRKDNESVHQKRKVRRIQR